MLAQHGQTWLIVALIVVAGASVRHFINRHEAHDPLGKFAWALPVAAVALGAAVFFTAPRTDPGIAGLQVSDAEVLTIVGKHCIMCHATRPSHEGFDAPPKGVILTSIDEIVRHKEQVMAQAVNSDTMPLGNETGMTEEERRKLGAYLASH
jgi:uncharacterized membrane protein